jgi:CheY-like chemotaxis protein
MTNILPVSAVPEGAPAYLVDCHACGATYDTLGAAWCNCIVKERTLVCAACEQCFCRADLEYKRNIWTAAPEALWERKVRNARQLFALPDNPPPESVTRPLVLVVDDDRDIRSLATHLITGWGFGCIHSANGTDGLALARRYRPNLILTDALMPKMDGRELCRLVKCDSNLASTKVVIMSSVYTSGRFKREALSHFKADDYVAKPVDAHVLLRLITEEQREERVAPLVAPDDRAPLVLEDPDNANPFFEARPDRAQALIEPEPIEVEQMPIADAGDEVFLIGDAPQSSDPSSSESRATGGRARPHRLRLSARELIRLRALGLDSELATVSNGIPGLSAVDLVAVHTAGVPIEFVRSLDPDLLASLPATDLITLYSSGCEPASINTLLRLRFGPVDIIGLVGANIPLSFIEDVVAAAVRPLSAGELVRLSAAGVDAGYVRALRTTAAGNGAVEEWIRLFTLGVTPDYLSVAAQALSEPCGSDELLQLWLSGVDVALLQQVRDGI